ncbi:MAG: CAP domain-containing protein [Parvularculaceae bacterium]|nr:CAP domain-containing protein [Parvularculaceae bacterium]
MAQTAVAPSNASYRNPAETEAILALVNSVRRREGLSELKLDAALTEAATRYAAELAARGELSHIGPDGSAPPDRANAAGYSGRYVAETLSAGYEEASPLVDAWMDSPSHRAALLLERASDLGVGRAVDPARSEIYWTVLVAAPADAGDPY